MEDAPSSLPLPPPPPTPPQPEPAPAPGGENALILAEIERLSRSRGTWQNGILLLLISLGVFVGVHAARGTWDPSYIVLLVVVLFVHELGHWAAMRMFGYQNVRMLFLPFFGAVTKGRNYNASGWEKALVYLAGPLPGILLATGLAVIAFVAGESEQLSKLILVAIILNGINLLPLVPLDGGWFLNSILFCRSPFLESGFRIVAGGALIFVGAQTHNPVVLAVGALALIRVRSTWRYGRLAQELRRQSGGALGVSPDGRSIPAAAAEKIIAALRARFGARATKVMALQTVNVFERVNARPPHLATAIFLLVIYLGTLAVGAFGLFVRGQAARGGLQAAMQGQQQGWGGGPPQGRRWGGPPRESRLKEVFKPGEMAEWTAPGPHVSSTNRYLFEANYHSSSAAKSAFDKMARSPARAAAWVGQSVFVVTDRSNDLEVQEVRKALSGDAASLLHVDSAIDSWPEAEIACIAPDAGAGSRLSNELEQYFELSHALMGQIAPAPPWFMPSHSDSAKVDMDRRARTTWLTLARAEADVRVNRLLQKLHKDAGKASKHGDSKEQARLGKEFSEKRLQSLESAIRSNTEGAADQALVDGELELARADAARDMPGFDIRRGPEWERLKGLLQQHLLLVATNETGRSADDVTATGDTRIWDVRLNFTISPSRPDRCLPLVLKWLADQGCIDIRYELRGDHDEGASPLEPAQ